MPKLRFQDVGKLTKAQDGVLRVLKDGPARVSNKNVAEPEDARRVSSAAWSFAYGEIRAYGMVAVERRVLNNGRRVEWWANLTDRGREYLAWLDLRSVS
jgi:hypothetical protein